MSVLIRLVEKHATLAFFRVPSHAAAYSFVPKQETKVIGPYKLLVS